MKNKAIVENKGTLYLMGTDDFRYNSPKYGYAVVTQVTKREKGHVQGSNGHRVFVVHGSNGNTYEVFGDYSAKQR